MIGDWIETTPELTRNPILFSLEKNGEVVQNGNNRDMIFSVNKIIANISQYFSLNIDDLIFTGTPAGVGECVVGDELTGYLGDKKLFYTQVK